MTNKFQVNGYNLLDRRRLSLTDKNQDNQGQKKSIRMLQLIFQTNLSKFVRKNKQAFGGEIETNLGRSFLNIEEYDIQKKVLQNIDDHIDKLTKAMLLRNSYLEKQFKSFEQRYKEYIGGEPTPDNPQNESRANNQPETMICMTNENSWEGYLSKADLSKSQTVHSRPFSSTIENPRTQERRKTMLKLSSRPLSSQFSRQIKQRPSINLKNVDIHNVKIQREKRKVPLFRQSLCQINDFQRYQQQEVYIRKKIIPQQVIQNPQVSLRTGSALYSRRGDKPNIAQKFRNIAYSKEQIQEIQKKKLFNKIMMVNTVLAFNLHQTQGYKAKSKCWSNPAI